MIRDSRFAVPLFERHRLNVDMARQTFPLKGETSRSGGTISRKTPWNPAPTTAG